MCVYVYIMVRYDGMIYVIACYIHDIESFATETRPLPPAKLCLETSARNPASRKSWKRLICISMRSLRHAGGSLAACEASRPTWAF